MARTRLSLLGIPLGATIENNRLVAGSFGQTGTSDGTNTYTLTTIGKYAIPPVPMKDQNGNVLANMVGLRGWWFDTPLVGASLPVATAAATNLTTDGVGKLSWNVTGLSSLSVGQTGYMIVTNSSGNPAQSPSWRGWQGPVTLSQNP